MRANEIETLAKEKVELVVEVMDLSSKLNHLKPERGYGQHNPKYEQDKTKLTGWLAEAKEEFSEVIEQLRLEPDER